MKLTRRVCIAEIERLQHIHNTTTVSLGVSREYFGPHSVESLSLSRALLEVGHTLEFWRQQYQILMENEQR